MQALLLVSATVALLVRAEPPVPGRPSSQYGVPGLSAGMPLTDYGAPSGFGQQQQGPFNGPPSPSYGSPLPPSRPDVSGQANLATPSRNYVPAPSPTGFGGFAPSGPPPRNPPSRNYGAPAPQNSGLSGPSPFGGLSGGYGQRRPTGFGAPSGPSSAFQAPSNFGTPSAPAPPSRPSAPSAPSSSYGSPSGAFVPSAPSSSYGAPSNFGAPSAPSQGYGPPTNFGAAPPNKFGFGATAPQFGGFGPQGGPSGNFGRPNQLGGRPSPSRPLPSAPGAASFGPPSSSYGPGPAPDLPPQYGAPGQEDEASEPVMYSFEYEVDAPEYGTQFGHQESRDGDVATGSYHVLLPDGRMQRVQYVADENGYRPEISYEDTGVGPVGGPQGGPQGGPPGGPEGGLGLGLPGQGQSGPY